MIELPVMIKTFLSDFEKKFKVPQLTTQSTVYIPKEYEELVAELIGLKLKRAVCILPLDSEYGPKFRSLKVGDRWDINQYIELGYINVERVWNTGEISVLGDTVILWPFSSKNIFRVILSGNDVESIERLEPGSRKKVESVDFVRIVDNTHGVVANESSKDMLLLRNAKDAFQQDFVDIGIGKLPNLNIYTGKKTSINILNDYKRRGYEIWYISKNILRYEGIVNGIDRVYEAANPVEASLSFGFVYEPSKILLLTDREVLGEFDLGNEYKSKKIDPSSVEILKKIIPGDFVVHEDHGIGKFVDIIEREGSQYIEIAYAGNDRLYIPLSASSKIMKYVSSGKYQPRLTGLNSGLWSRVSSKAKEDVEKIAQELLQIYALREISKGIKILNDQKSVDEYWQFANEFEFTDTEDQYIATKNISLDLQKEKPMDRLLVGDVGFGKTEIAMRAAFAVANAGMQVAVLAPTTVLANQHLRVFKERFKKYPFKISLISRLQDLKEREKTISELGEGKVDILIGTHAILSENVKFKNLGLIVVDEEQKFGVRQKEKLKSSRVDTHVLSMTATPIPRTLNLSLLGVRDISVLAIAPQGRVEIRNEFSQFSFEKIKGCIERELQRGGQVYYLHNSIENIEFVAEKILNMIPKVRIEVAHGRLSGEKLIKVMDSFLGREIDVLLCTTIIENGLDISNANTLIVDDVNRLGLSQMYQIRGRVGRGQRQAYACFFYESLKGDSALRLEAIKESQALGSGFLLSNRDLEIRGAGDILGKRQCGTINSIGYGLYTQLLSEAVEKLKTK